MAGERMCYSARASPLTVQRMEPTPEENDDNDEEEEEDAGKRRREGQRTTRSELRTDDGAPEGEDEDDEEDRRRKSSACQSAASGLSGGRRRAVDMSDFRSCALVQSKLKSWQGLSSTRFVTTTLTPSLPSHDCYK